MNKYTSHQVLFARLLNKELEFKSVLDLGCGAGEVLRELRTMCDVECVGMDISAIWDSPPFRDLSHMNEIQFDIGDIIAPLKYEDNSFDLVITSAVLLQFEDVDFIIKEMKRVAKKYIVVFEYQGEENYERKDRVIRDYTKYFDNTQIKRIESAWEFKEVVIAKL